MTQKFFFYVIAAPLIYHQYKRLLNRLARATKVNKQTAAANTASAPQSMAKVTKPKQCNTRNSQKTATATQVIQLSVSSIATDVKVVISPKDTVKVENPKRQTSHRGKKANSLEGASLLM